MILIDTPAGYFSSFLDRDRVNEVEVLFSNLSRSTKISINKYELPKVEWRPAAGWCREVEQGSDGLMEIYFQNIDPEPRITPDQAHEWLLKVAEHHHATELHFRQRFEAVPIDRYNEGIPETGDYVSALVSFVREKKND